MNTEQTKISIILPSFLGDYPGSAKMREYKLRRAIESVLNQKTTVDWELIVVSDCCFKTNSILKFEYQAEPRIKHINLTEKQHTFSGSVRQAGLQAATGTIICYLDSDDQFTEDHLQNIADKMQDNDILFFDDILFFGREGNGTAIKQARICEPVKNKIGTSNIAHKKVFKGGYQPSWNGCDGYGHDYHFIQRMQLHAIKSEKVAGGGYIVCHINDMMDV